MKFRVVIRYVSVAFIFLLKIITRSKMDEFEETIARATMHVSTAILDTLEDPRIRRLA